MKDVLSEARALLELTRAGYAPPDAAARERVRQRIVAAVAAGAVVAGSSAAQASNAGKLGSSKLTASNQLQAPLKANFFVKLAMVTSITVVGTAAWLMTPHSTPPLRSLQTVVAKQRDVATGSAAAPRVIVTPMQVPAELQVDASEAGVAQAEVIAAALPASTPHIRRHHAHSTSESSLSAEVLLLHHAENAILSGDPELALSVLRAHRSRFPHANLREEQAGLVALARCTLDAYDARPARRFLVRYPASVLSARVRRACALASQ